MFRVGRGLNFSIIFSDPSSLILPATSNLLIMDIDEGKGEEGSMKIIDIYLLISCV